METIRRRIAVLTALFCFAVFSVLSGVTVVEAEDYSDGAYWSAYCSQEANMSSNACKGYVQYLTTQSEDYQKQLDEIEAQRDEIAANLEAYDAQLKQYQADIEAQQTKIDAQQAKIDEQQAKIDAKQVEIDDTQKEIDDTQAEVDELGEKVKKRMVSSQGTMRLSQTIDVLMGATSFSDFLRIANGLNAIAEYDKSVRDELVNLVDLLNEQKAALEKAKQELEDAKAEMEEEKQVMVDEQNRLIILQEQCQVIIDEAEKQYSLLQAQSNQISSNISAIQETLKQVDVDSVGSAVGWTFPVPGSYRSAGTWAYSGGSTHLGIDLAASVGTPILAVAPGLVINSANGCPTYGYLGNPCGSAQGGVAYGGNQVTLLCKINGSLFAITYAHMQLNSPIALGSTVSAGQQIGAVGASGNTTGPHTHIEIFYLGDASNFSSFARNWSGDMSFGCGWAGSYDGYGRRCDAGYSAPCRMRPEEYFGM